MCDRCAEFEKRLEALRLELDRVRYEARFWHSIADSLEREAQALRNARAGVAPCMHVFEGGRCTYCGTEA